MNNSIPNLSLSDSGAGLLGQTLATAAETTPVATAFDDPAPFRVAFPRTRKETKSWFAPPAVDAFPEWAACRGED